MRRTNLIQVLWVEDDPEVIATYPLEAARYGIQLVHFACWDDAENALKQDFDRWSAIVLDAKCCLHSNSVDSAPQFLMNVTNAITRLCHGKRFIPWYVLSGQAETDIKLLIPESRKDWDGDWEKPFYDKNIDRAMLYSRIRNVARTSKSASLKIHEMYKPVFDAIDDLKLNDDVDNHLTDLLSELHFSELDDNDFNDKYKKVRQIVEHIFRSAIEKGLLPPQAKINLSWSNRILSGQNVMAHDEVIVDVYQTVFPKIIQDNLIHMIHTASSDVHTEHEEDTNTKHLQDYLSKIGNTTYLLKSYALQLCDVILYYHKYVEQHPNINSGDYWAIRNREKFYGRA